MKNGPIKVAAGTPLIKIADPAHNARELVRLTKEANALGVQVLVFPALSLTGASCGDLFCNETLLCGAKAALCSYLEQTAAYAPVSVVGLPWSTDTGVYNCAAVCHRGRLLGLSVKSLAPVERRWFTDAELPTSVSLNGQAVPVANALTLCVDALPVRLGVVMSEGEDANAEILCVPLYEPEVVGASARRAAFWKEQSERTGAAYTVSYAGAGESTTDSVCGGQKLIVANGALLDNAPPFCTEELLIGEVDASTLVRKPVESRTQMPSKRKKMPEAPIDPHPFFPADPQKLALHCKEILNIQAAGLAARVERAYAKKIVVGISGGLDSTLALLVMVRAMDSIKRPRTDIIAVTMPCFGTTVRTKTNATVLCEELGVDFRRVDIFDAVNQHFKDIGHDPSVHDVTYENAQARERTQVLMDVANDCGGLVVGTGDLSELALGWATYNGDHMSMYGVNAGLPKTLIRHVVAHCAAQYRAEGFGKIADALFDILDTPVSPELLPADADGKIAQKTEDLVGPYELHDFYLYYMLSYAPTPAKLYAWAKEAFGGTYDDETLKKWLKVFLRRFFNQQFKRSCLPDGPRVFPVSLSPRGAWVMPSDASSALWLAEADIL